MRTGTILGLRAPYQAAVLIMTNWRCDSPDKIPDMRRRTRRYPVRVQVCTYS